MLGKRKCQMGSCGSAAVTTLDYQAFCLNHFLLRCYAELEGLDPRGRQSSSETVDLVSMRAFIEECSRKALDISLQSEEPDQSSARPIAGHSPVGRRTFRLLFRAPRIMLAQSLASTDGGPAARAATPNF